MSYVNLSKTLGSNKILIITVRFAQGGTDKAEGVKQDLL